MIMITRDDFSSLHISFCETIPITQLLYFEVAPNRHTNFTFITVSEYVARYFDNLDFK
jgi:hypothetical protein